MTLKIIVSRKDSSCQQLVLEYLDKVQEILGRVIANVVHLIRWYWQSVFACCLFWCMLHDANYSLDNVINVCEVAFAVAIIENLDGFAFHQFVGKTEVCHVRATGWTINGEETETCAGDVVELAVGVRHKLVALLRGGIEADGVIDLIFRAVGYLLVAAIYR